MKSFFAATGFSVGLVALLTCWVSSARGQTGTVRAVHPPTHRFAYAAVVPVPGTNQADLLRRALAWSQRQSLADRPPVLTSEPGTGTVRTAGVRPFVETAYGQVHRLALHFTAQLDVREGRYRYELTEFVIVYPATRRGAGERIPAEDYFNGRVIPLAESGARSILAMRACFAEAAQEAQDDLKAAMSQPASPKEQR